MKQDLNKLYKKVKQDWKSLSGDIDKHDLVFESLRRALHKSIDSLTHNEIHSPIVGRCWTKKQKPYDISLTEIVKDYSPENESFKPQSLNNREDIQDIQDIFTEEIDNFNTWDLSVNTYNCLGDFEVNNTKYGVMVFPSSTIPQE